jgi:hypothetical protein
MEEEKGLLRQTIAKGNETQKFQDGSNNARLLDCFEMILD